MSDLQEPDLSESLSRNFEPTTHNRNETSSQQANKPTRFRRLISQNGHASRSRFFLLIFCLWGCGALCSIWRDARWDAACHFGGHRQLPIIHQHVNRFQHTLQIISAQLGEASKWVSNVVIWERTGGQKRQWSEVNMLKKGKTAMVVLMVSSERLYFEHLQIKPFLAIPCSYVEWDMIIKTNPKTIQWGTKRQTYQQKTGQQVRPLTNAAPESISSFLCSICWSPKNSWISHKPSMTRWLSTRAPRLTTLLVLSGFPTATARRNVKTCSWLMIITLYLESLHEMLIQYDSNGEL